MPVGGYLYTVIVILSGAGIILVGYLAITYLLKSARSAGRPTKPVTASVSPSTGSMGTATEQRSKTEENAANEIDSTATEATDHSDEKSWEDSSSSTAEAASDGATSPEPRPRQVVQMAIGAQSTRYRATSGARTRWTTRTYGPLPGKGRSSSRSDNTYFKVVDSDGTARYLDLDRTASLFDLDYGPELVEFSILPDGVVIDLGPSAVSRDVVQSPLEFKITSFIKALLTPSQNDGLDHANESGQSAVANYPVNHRTDTAYRGGRETYSTSQESSYPLTPFSDFQGDSQSVDQPAGETTPFGTYQGTTGDDPDLHLSAQRDQDIDPESVVDGFGLDEGNSPLADDSDQPVFPGQKSSPAEHPVASEDALKVDGQAFEPVINVEDVLDPGNDGGSPFDIQPGYSPVHGNLQAANDVAQSGDLDVLEPMIHPPAKQDEHRGGPFQMSPGEALGFGAEQFGRDPEKPVDNPLLQTEPVEEIGGGGWAGSGTNDMLGLPGCDDGEVLDPLFAGPGFGSDGDTVEDWFSL